MKRNIVIWLSILMTALLTGCASVIVVESEPNMVEVSNTGCFLFSTLPLFSGDISCPNQQEPVIFKDTLSLENNFKLLDWMMKKQGATRYENVVSHFEDERVIWILLTRKTLHTSAVLQK